MNIDLDKHILPWVENPIPVLALQAHPRNVRITGGDNDSGFDVLADDRTGLNHYNGLLTPLAECFWPNELTPEGQKRNRKAASAASKTGPMRAGGGVSKKQRRRQYKTAQEAVKGRSRGSLVHRHIHELILLGEKGFLKKNPEGAHPWAKMVHKLLLRRGWRPVCAEKRVFNERLRIATAVDLVCVDVSGRLHFIEVKTGFGTTEEWCGVHNGPMRAPLHNIFTNCALNRAKIQCMMGAFMAIQGHGIEGDDAFMCHVVHVCDRGIECIGIDPDVVKNFGPMIQAALVQHRRRTNKIKEIRAPAPVQIKQEDGDEMDWDGGRGGGFLADVLFSFQRAN